MNGPYRLASTFQRLRSLVLPASGADTQPSSALFRGIRWRLTLWYSAVLAAVLIVAGVVLYAGVRYSLLSPITQSLQTETRDLGGNWQNSSVRLPGFLVGCDRDLAPPNVLWVCYDSQGRVVGQSDYVRDLAPGVANSSLVQAAMQNGQAGDTMGSPLGTLQRYAVRVPTADGDGTLGVVLVATQIGSSLSALDTLLHLLLVLGVLMLLVAVVAGLLLANRALQPARLAYDRQRDFIADASHELRTPLTMLRSNVEVVLRGGERLPPDDVALLEDTVSEARHLTSLANSMLDLASLEGKEVHLEEDVVDLAHVAGEVARWAQTVAAESKLSVAARSNGPVLVLGDRLLLQQAILILVDNAIKYNRPGGAIVVDTWSEGERAHLAVRDTGIGIEAVHLSRLGERFYRVDKARSRESGGAGLGLSIVNRIMARHGGTFSIESEPGSGTTARLSMEALPTSVSPAEVIESAV